MYEESVFFIGAEGASSTASLLFAPERVLSFHDARRETTFEEGRDFEVRRDERTWCGSPVRGCRAPHAEDVARLICADDDAFHRRQVEVTYTHAGGWDGLDALVRGRGCPRHDSKASSRRTGARGADRRQHFRGVKRLGLHRRAAVSGRLRRARRGRSRTGVRIANRAPQLRGRGLDVGPRSRRRRTRRVGESTTGHRRLWDERRQLCRASGAGRQRQCADGSGTEDVAGCGIRDRLADAPDPEADPASCRASRPTATPSRGSAAAASFWPTSRRCGRTCWRARRITMSPATA